MIDMNNDKIYTDILFDLTNVNAITKPRDMSTKEILGYHTKFDMAHPMLMNSLRKLNYKFMFGEAKWILTGSNTVKDISRHLHRISQYSDNGYVFNGAYGPHFHRQRNYIVRTLVHDKDTRQAVLTIWQERPEASKDIPCTVSLQWLIRDNAIHCIVNMRSSDAWLGLPYDLFNWGMMSLDIAAEYHKTTGVQLQPGSIYYNAGSCHLYLRDIDKATAASMFTPAINEKHIMQTVPWDFIVKGETTVIDYLDFKLERLYAQE
tara:strand:+ start:299 stop:1084 length:786 start_codon:yes stop_codon:yes gene_type:complete